MNIEELKYKILQLAIQGKLVKQDLDDECADKLIESIKKEKANLIIEKKIRKEKPFPIIKDNEKPFIIPSNWAFIRYGDVAQFKKGPFGSNITKSMFVPKSEETIKVYEQKNAIQKDINIGDYYITKEKFQELKSFELFPGDIIVSCAGTIGETFTMPDNMERGILNQALMKVSLSQYIEREYFLMYFDYILHSQITNVSKGSAIKNIPPLKHLKNIVFPLPPLKEQQRIVRKVHQITTLINDLTTEKEELMDTIKLTRNQVLQEAVQGKLVEQNPNDKPASIQLNKIKLEKEELIKSKKIRKINVNTTITDDEKAFEIPESWEWVRLGEILTKITDGAHHTPIYTETGIPFLSVKDLSSGQMDFTDTRFISRESHDDLYKRCNPEYGDLLLTKVGTTGIPLIVDTDKEFSLFVSVALLKFNKDFNYNRYLLYLINSPLIKEKSQANTRGVGNKNLVLRDIANFTVPIPPIEEQKRIVEKLDIVMDILDNLEKEVLS